MTRKQRIEALLTEALAPLELCVVDDSQKHIGHPGARDGRGHFSVRVCSAAFDGVPKLARHRQIYQILGAMLETDVHALAIEALAPRELASHAFGLTNTE